MQNEILNVSELTGKLRSEMSKVIVGQDAVIQMLIAALFADGHVLIEGVPGVAKTLMANALARSVDVKFSRLQFTPDLMPGDVIGTAIYHPQKLEFEFRRGPVFSNIVLIDEINRAPAKTQAALFEVMEEKQITYDGITHVMDEPFLVLATQNPVEQEGTYRLPEAQLDRFLIKVIVNYPTLDEEVSILQGHNQQASGTKPVSLVEPVMHVAQVLECRNLTRKVHAEKHLLNYIAELVSQTRQSKFIYLGASPRASIAILNLSKSIAVMNGRDFITPDDIQTVSPHALRHRLILTPEKEMEGVSTDEVVKSIINKIEVPR